MVQLLPGRTNSSLLALARDLATRIGAKVIGIAACQPASMAYQTVTSPALFVDQDRRDIAQRIKETEDEFRLAFDDHPSGIEWRSATVYETVADYISRECRSVDLLITSNALEAQDTAERHDPGDIVLQAGRPVLVVPSNIAALDPSRMAIAWKNTREARRAVGDALPLLALADHVTLLEVADEDERPRVDEQLFEMCIWLASHKIIAEPRFVPRSGGKDSEQLNAALEAIGATTVVAGAYGHSRLREWALGGVTRDLTLRARYCSLLSH